MNSITIKEDHTNHAKPNEDTFRCNSNVFVVSDGITLDPSGEDWSDKPVEWRFRNYPKESMAKVAAEIVADAIFESLNNGSGIYESFLKANSKVAQLNSTREKIIDYLSEDYWGAIASCVVYREDKKKIEYGYMGDCGIAVINRNGELVFKTNDDISNYYQFIENRGLEWGNPEARQLVRKHIRNNPRFYFHGKLVGFGAINGQRGAEYFVRTGSISVQTGDTIIVHSDGFEPYTRSNTFLKKVAFLMNSGMKTSAIKHRIQNLQRIMLLDDPKRYGQERTAHLIWV